MGRWALAVALTCALVLPAACASAVAPSGAAPPEHYVPWLPLPPKGLVLIAPESTVPLGPPVVIPPGTPACRANQLEGVAPGMRGEMGQTTMPIVLRNRGASRCYLEGFADVTVFSRDGRVLAQVAGLTGRGTYFDVWHGVPVLMELDTPTFSTTSNPGPHAIPGVRGQALMNLSWYDYRTPQAANVAVDLPTDAGRLIVPFPFKAAVSQACESQGTVGLTPLSRGPFSPSGFDPPSEFLFVEVVITMQAPASVRHGSTLAYFVTLTNASHTVYSLETCPDYVETVDGKLANASYQLNCGPMDHIAPGGGATFEMRIDVPASAPRGSYLLTWGLIDGRINPNSAETTIEIA